MLLGTETKRASLPGSGQDEMADDVRGLDGVWRESTRSDLAFGSGSRHPICLQMAWIARCKGRLSGQPSFLCFFFRTGWVGLRWTALDCAWQSALLDSW